MYSLDVDPQVLERLKVRSTNVEYLIGPSDQTLPPLIHRLQSEKSKLGFVLVDGDQSREGVRKDIDNVLQFSYCPPDIVMHDSFNSECRLGLRAANWSGCPHVHAVELDIAAVPSSRHLRIGGSCGVAWRWASSSQNQGGATLKSPGNRN